MVWHHHKAKLFSTQQGHSISIRQPYNGRPIFRTNCRDLPTTHRTHTLSPPNTQTQNHKLLPICGWHFTNIRLHPYQHTDDPWGLQFIAEAEKDHNLNYLDISIQRTSTNIKTAIYRKPTFTDTIMPYTSNHPTRHKYATVRFLFNRLHSYNLKQEEYQHELNIIHNILYNNAFPIKPHTPPPPTQNPTRPTAPWTTKHKWTSFTYVGKETSYITNLFRKTELEIAFHTTNTRGNLLSHKNPTPNTFSLSGVYRLTCPDCNKAYVGQGGRRFATWSKEHAKAFRSNSHTSSFTKHLNEEAHSFGPMNSIMQILHYHKKRNPPKHTWKISHPHRVCHKQPLKWKPNHISERNL